VAEATEVAAVEVVLAVVVEAVPVVAVLILRESRVSTRRLIIAAADVPE